MYSAVIEALRGTVANEAKRLFDPGPEKWCKRCSRRHGSRQRCGLVVVAVQAKSGRMVKRWAHPQA
ncbi:MAG TPA: hypothetical protein VFH80_10235 [Solirubrobacteraceae bacterium]|nr:hypothetical protein [Solirubrobacteraceae bacterium]